MSLVVLRSSRVEGQRIASLVAGIVLSPLGLLASAPPATAHPSDFATLTLDLLVGPDGLEAIDAAVVESTGPGYEPFPTSESKQAVATDVLEALHVPLDQVDIDAETSERYHEVGFLVRFNDPSLGADAPLSIDTTDLQRIASDRNLRHLRLSVCSVTDGPQSPGQHTLADLDIQASQPGQPPTGQDRPACEIWRLTPTDPPVAIEIVPSTAAGSGFGLAQATVVALTVVFGSIAVFILGSRIRR
jgi:hypothetical protein